MGVPAVLSENVFNARQFTGHTLSASSEAAGREDWHVADGRRHPDDHWAASAANTEAWIEAQCDRVRGATMLALDRGHNLSGVSGVKLQGSQDGDETTPTWFDILEVTIPSVVGGTLDTGVVTDEGAYLLRFDQENFQWWRLFIPAMGAGLAPRVVGLWVGTAWEPGHALQRPYADEDDDLLVRSTATDAGWAGRSTLARRRSGTMRVRLDSFSAYELARYHIVGRYGSGYPSWLIHDDDEAYNAVQAVRPQGRQGFRFERGWGYRRADIQWQEHEPAARP